MGIWDRLGRVIEGSVKDFLDNDDARIFGGGRGAARGDQDFEAAFEELNDYLNREKKDSPHGRSAGAWGAPEELRPDFAELGVSFGAPADECKAAYKRLLKIHHPDRHAGQEGNYHKATAKTARINAAFDRIEQWRQGG